MAYCIPLKKKKQHGFIYTSLNLHGNLGGEEIAYEASWLVWEIFQTECPFCSSELEGVCCNCAEWQTSKAEITSVFRFPKYTAQLTGVCSRVPCRLCFSVGTAAEKCAAWDDVILWIFGCPSRHFFPRSWYLVCRTTDGKCGRNSSGSILPMETSTLHVWERKPVTSVLPIKATDITDILSFSWATVPIGANRKIKPCYLSHA